MTKLDTFLEFVKTRFIWLSFRTEQDLVDCCFCSQLIYIYCYSLLSSILNVHMSHVILKGWLYPFIAHIINIHGNGVLVALCGCCMAGATCELLPLQRMFCVYTIQPCTRLQFHFIRSHIDRVCACLAVTCHLHFWQNDRDLLRATATKKH